MIDDREHFVIVCFLFQMVGLTLSNNISINADDRILALYFDGVRVSGVPHAGQAQVADRIPLPPDTRLIAVFALNDDGPGALQASDSDGAVFSEKLWKYSLRNEPGWTNESFDDSHWKTTAVLARNDNATAGWYHVALISRHASFVWSNGWDATQTDFDKEVYFRYRIQENVRRRNFDKTVSGYRVKGVWDRCAQGSRLRCAARCGRLPMSNCAAFQQNTVSKVCCLINGSFATNYKAHLDYDPNWMIYSAVNYNDPCC